MALQQSGKPRKTNKSAKLPAPAAEEVKPGDRIIVTIKSIGINGEGVGYYKRKAVFIQGALPGEVIRATVAKIEPRWMYAAMTEIEKKSPDRVHRPVQCTRSAADVSCSI